MKTTNLLLTIILFFSAHPIFAMAQRPVDPNAPPPPAWIQFFPFIVMIGVFYFFLIRPQMRQKREKEQMMTSLKKGDHVITQGGLIGTIVNVNVNTFDLKIGDDTKVKVLKSAVVDMYKEQVDVPQPTAIINGK